MMCLQLAQGNDVQRLVCYEDTNLLWEEDEDPMYPRLVRQTLVQNLVIRSPANYGNQLLHAWAYNIEIKQIIQL